MHSHLLGLLLNRWLEKQTSAWLEKWKHKDREVKQNEGCDLSCCCSVEEPAEDRGPTKINSIEPWHLCRGGGHVEGSVLQFGTAGLFSYLPKEGNSRFVVGIWVLKGDFADSGCDLREACSSQFDSCREKHKEIICRCLTRSYFYSRPTLLCWTSNFVDPPGLQVGKLQNSRNARVCFHLSFLFGKFLCCSLLGLLHRSLIQMIHTCLFLFNLSLHMELILISTSLELE